MSSEHLETDSDDDDVPTLSSEALAALQFLNLLPQQREDIQLTESALDKHEITISEDWRLSQFWYDEATTEALGNKTLHSLNLSDPTEVRSIACISCPTLFRQLYKIKPENLNVILFEYDDRFNIYAPDFVHYDFNHPTKVPDMYKEYFDLVCADPPCLSEDCIQKTSETVSIIRKQQDGKIVFCTGELMAEYLEEFLKLKKSKFVPRHKSKLGNEFACFTNFEFDEINR